MGAGQAGAKGRRDLRGGQGLGGGLGIGSGLGPPEIGEGEEQAVEGRIAHRKISGQRGRLRVL